MQKYVMFLFVKDVLVSISQHFILHSLKEAFILFASTLNPSDFYPKNLTFRPPGFQSSQTSENPCKCQYMYMQMKGERPGTIRKCVPAVLQGRKSTIQGNWVDALCKKSSTLTRHFHPSFRSTLHMSAMNIQRAPFEGSFVWWQLNSIWWAQRIVYAG